MAAAMAPAMSVVPAGLAAPSPGPNTPGAAVATPTPAVQEAAAIRSNSVGAGDGNQAPPAPGPQGASGSAKPGGAAPAGAGANGDVTPQQVYDKYKTEIDNASAQTGVPKEILAAAIWQESRGNPNAPGGGLLQLGDNEFSKYGGGDINNPADNILAGAKYLKDMYGQFGSWDLALRAYNSGPNGVDPNNPDATPAGTGDPTYVEKVLEAAAELGYTG